jgi:hypothetical protein
LTIIDTMAILTDIDREEGERPMDRYRDPAVVWLMARGHLDLLPDELDQDLSNLRALHEAQREAAERGVSLVDRARAAIAAFRAPGGSARVDCSDCLPA